MPLHFNKTADLKLLQLVKENQILYNTKHPNYIDFDAREVVWQKIGDALHRPAAIFAGIQCQVQYGDFSEEKHKPGFIENLEEYLPQQYCNSWGIEKKIYKAFKKYQGQSSLDAKYTYIKTARDLPTYGVTFFLVKEKQKGKKKLIPRLLGINAESILRLDHDTKEILQSWPLTHVKTYHTGKTEMFTLNFGEYSDKEYSVKTQDAYRIRDILEGYIDIIRRRMYAKPGGDGSESMAICDDTVNTGQAHLIQHVSQNATKMAEASFVGPQRIVPYEGGQSAQSGTQIVTVQRIMVADHAQHQQQALKGEVPLRGDMSLDCARKLNRMNSNSVKIVNLLTEPNNESLMEAQKIVDSMREDLPIVQQGITETAEKQSVEDSKKMLMNELEELNNYMKQLDEYTKPETMDTESAKEAAENIAGLTTQICFSLDNKIRKRNDIMRRSRKSFIEDEKTLASIRRGSFIAAANTAIHSMDIAKKALSETYSGPHIDDTQKKRLEKALEDKMGKLNAALALYLTAHSDPQNIDYSTAINSMNTINELMPQLALDAQMYASSLDPEARKQFLSEMRTLLEAADKICTVSNSEDREKLQEAANTYSDVAGRLIFTLSRGKNAEKENEIIELAQDVGAKTSLLLMSANELTGLVPDAPAAAAVDDAGADTATSARALLACAQLTAPAIREPHCQSALTAAAESLSSSVQHLETSWKPLLDQPSVKPMGGQLRARVVDVNKALQRLKDAYQSLYDDEEDDVNDTQQKELSRLKFIKTISGVKDKLQGVENEWGKTTSSPTAEQQQLAQLRLQQQLARLNAAIAALASATADGENIDHEAAEKATRIISELLPLILQDGDIATYGQDETARTAMLDHLKSLCNATRNICGAAGEQQGIPSSAADFAAASNKLTFLISPNADRSKEDQIMDLTASACAQASVVLSNVQGLTELLPGDLAQLLDDTGASTADAAQALLSIAQVSAPCISEPEASRALISAAERLRNSSSKLTAACNPHVEDNELMKQNILSSQRKLEACLDALVEACPIPEGLSQKEKRLKFIKSASSAKGCLTTAAQLLDKPTICHMMSEEDYNKLQRELCQRVAELYAAMAVLEDTGADGEHVDYGKATRAVNSIKELMPHVVRDARVVCSFKNSEEQAELLQRVRELCEASCHLCDSDDNTQGVNNAAAKFGSSSKKLVFLINPPGDKSKEKQITDLSSAAFSQATSLASNMKDAGHHVDVATGSELVERADKISDGARRLQALAQILAPTVQESDSSNDLLSAIAQLHSAATVPEPYALPSPHQQKIRDDSHLLKDILNKMAVACNARQDDVENDVNDAQQKELSRLKFIKTISGVKDKLQAVENEWGKTTSSPTAEQQQLAQHRLQQQLARLNAAIAALASATADGENIDHEAAEKATRTISELLPFIMQDGDIATYGQDETARTAMMDHLKSLCNATRNICGAAGEQQGVPSSAADFAAASNKLTFLISPNADRSKVNQIMDLTASACAQASVVLSNVQGLTEMLPGDLAQLLDDTGASTADAAQALLSIAQVSAPCISEPKASRALISAAERLRNSSYKLTAACNPYVEDNELMKRNILSNQRKLEACLDALVEACPLPKGMSQKEKRLKFVKSASSAKGCLATAAQLLDKPTICHMMSEEDYNKLQRELCQRVAELYAAMAVLEDADGEHVDYEKATRAVNSIKELMPLVVRDARAVCSFKNSAEQAELLQRVRELCEASCHLCDSDNDTQGVNNAAAKFGSSSKKLMFLFSTPGDKAKEKQITDLSSAAFSQATSLASNMKDAGHHVDVATGSELVERADKISDGARRLQALAQILAPTVQESDSSNDLLSAIAQLHSAATVPESYALPSPHQQKIRDDSHLLKDTLNKMAVACNARQDDVKDDVNDTQQKELSRLKFIKTISGVKDKLQGVENEWGKTTSSPTAEQQQLAQHRLQQQLARLNAAIAALASATADGENIDHEAAEKATRTISELLPLIMQDGDTATHGQDETARIAMLDHLKSLCNATRNICGAAGEQQGIPSSAADFAAASNKLTFLISPNADRSKEDQIMDLTASACAQASVVLSNVQGLTELLPGDLAQLLDDTGASTADAAQALLSIAQVSAPCISEPEASRALILAAERLRNSSSKLTAAYNPHLKDNELMKQNILSNQRKLEACLDALVEACPIPEGMSQKEKRLQFIKRASSAKGCLSKAAQLLEKPTICHMMSEEDYNKLQRELCQRVAELYAAISVLEDTGADGEHVDYGKATRAVNSIKELMPLVVRDARAVCSFKNSEEQAELLQRVRELCEASCHLCDSDNDSQGVNNAAAKFGSSSKKLVFLISPLGDKAKEKQITDLSSAAFSQATSLASNMKDAGHHVDVATGSELVERADKISDDARRLQALAQILAHTVQESDSSNDLLSAIAQLHSAATVPEPYALPSSHQQKIRDDSHLLKDTLNKMAVACNARQVDVPDETSRRLLVDRAMHARDSLSVTRRMSIEPVICQMMREGDGEILQHQLYQRLAQLAAAVASLESVNTVGTKPNYLEAVRSITEVKDLMPLVVQDARTLCGTKTEAEQAALLHQIQELCDATTAICSNADNPKGLNEAASRFRDSSKKLVFLISPSSDPNKEIQIIGLSTAVHNQASALADELHHAASNVDGATAAELENKRDAIVESAHRLQAVAQVLAPALKDPTCSTDLQTAVSTLRSVSSLQQHTLQQLPEHQAQKLQHCSLRLQQALDKLEHACQIQDGKQNVQVSPEQERQQMKFMNSIDEARNNLQATERQLTQPLMLAPMAPEEVAPTQKKLAERRSRLDAAIAALNAALHGHKNRNYADADQALRDIMVLMPNVVQDARKLVAADKAPVDVLVDIDTKCKNVQKLLHKLEKEKLQATDDMPDFNTKTDKPMIVEKKVKPPVPIRDRRSHIEHNKGKEMTEDFIKRMRAEELREKQANEKALEKQQVIDKFSEAVDNSKEQLRSVQNTLQTLQKSKSSTPGSPTPAVEVAKREQRMEDNLAAAGVQVAQLVAANYVDQLDYEAALKPTEDMTQCIKQIVEDGAVVSGCLQGNARKTFIADLLALCEATNNICEAAKSDKKKLNEAAINFGNQSAKVLKVVSADVNPELEKEVISKAKAIGDCASCIASEAGIIANDSSFEDQAKVKQICEAIASCVDAAGKLVYTTKLVSPTVGHKISQNALVTSADNLHRSVETFSKTWESLASKSHLKLSQELEKLKQLLQKLQQDVRGGRFGSREGERHVVIDTPLREMTMQVIENAQNMAQLSELSPELRQKYTEYSSRLTQAMHAVDVASARFQRTPRDNIKREQMEMAIQELQMTLLQTRPSRSRQAQSDIVDFRDFLQDMATKAQELQTTAKTHKTAIGNDIDPITVLCSKIFEDANKLLNPEDVHHDTTEMTSEDDVVDIEQFGQDSEVMLKEINATINGIQDQKAKSALKVDALSLYESCQLLKFATNSHISATKSAAFDEALLDLDSFEKSILTPLATDILKKKKEKMKAFEQAVPCVDSSIALNPALQRRRSASSGAQLSAAPQQLSAALQQLSGGAPAHVSRALARHAAEQLAHAHVDDDLVLKDLKDLLKGVQEVTRAASFRIANWDTQHPTDTQIYKKLYDNKAASKSKHQILTEDDLDKLLSCELVKVEGTRMQLEDKLQQLSSKLSSMCGTIVMSVKKPESLARSSHVTADCAKQLANVARSLKDNRRPLEAKRIEEATQEMCLSTCNLLNTSELVCQDPGHHSSKRRLLEACRLLNDSINNLERVVSPSASSRVSQECERAQRCSAAQRALQRDAALPTAAMPYTDCLDTLMSQKDVFNKLNSKESLTREQFIQSLHYITSAVTNSADCATHAAYLLSLSEKDLETAKQGLVDVPKLQKQLAGVQETCVNIIMDLNTDQYEHEIPEKKKQLEREVTDLLKDLDDAVEKTKDPGLKNMLLECRKEVDTCAKSFYILVEAKTPKESLMSSVISLMYEVNYVGGMLEHPGLVPVVGNVSADTQAKWEEVTKCTGDLLSSTQDLIKEVKTSQHPDVMTWVVFNKRKNVLDAFDALIKTVRFNGHKVNLIEGLEETENENKSYIQSQVDLALKWLTRPAVKPEVKTNGQQAIQNILEIARKMQEDFKDNDEDDMSHLVVETEQLLTQCSSKYDQEQFSVLVERVRELQKVIERGLVTRVVEDFLEAEAPLADLDIMTDAETDEKKRKFILERKIAELLAHLGRVTKTARFIAASGSGGQKVSNELKTCSDQTELLAPMLVKAAQERIESPNNEAVIENYKSLLARYAESMSKVRDLCDQAVDPMDFVQTASVTMHRMREESTKHNDPMKCAYTSSVITKLANRVIQVGLSSSPVREDPELYRALTDAQQQLSAATPAPDTRHSKMPDWKDTTALIIRATDEVESVLGGESIFKKQPEPDQPIYNEALNLHVAIRDWSSRDNEIVAVAKRMAVLMAKLSDFMKSDKQRDVLTTSKNIVTESHEVARLAKKLAHECTDHRIKNNLLQACERIPTISGQLKMLTTVKGSSLGHHGTKEDKEAMDMLVGNAQSLMSSISDVIKAAASASVKIMSQRGPKIKWVRKNYY